MRRNELKKRTWERKASVKKECKETLPPPVTRSDEEPIATGARRF